MNLRIAITAIFLVATLGFRAEAQGLNPPNPTLQNPIGSSYDPLSPECVSDTNPGNIHVVGSNFALQPNGSPQGTPRYTVADLGIDQLLAVPEFTTPPNVDGFTNMTDNYPVFGITQHELQNWAAPQIGAEIVDCSVHYSVSRGTANPLNALSNFQAQPGQIWLPGDMVANSSLPNVQETGNGAASDTFIAQVNATTRYPLVHASDAYQVTPGVPGTDIDALYDGENVIYPVCWTVDSATAAEMEYIDQNGVSHPVSGADIFMTPYKGATPILYIDHSKLDLDHSENVNAIAIQGDPRPEGDPDDRELVFSIDIPTTVTQITSGGPFGLEHYGRYGAGALYFYSAPAGGAGEITVFGFPSNFGLNRPLLNVDPNLAVLPIGDLNASNIYDPPRHFHGDAYGEAGPPNPDPLAAVPGHAHEHLIMAIAESHGGGDNRIYLSPDPAKITLEVPPTMQTHTGLPQNLHIYLLVRPSASLAGPNNAVWSFNNFPIYVSPVADGGDAADYVNFFTGLDIPNGVFTTNGPDLTLETPYLGTIVPLAAIPPGVIKSLIFQAVLVGDYQSVPFAPYFIIGNCIEVRYGYDVDLPN